MGSLHIEFDHGTGGDSSIISFSWVDTSGVSHTPTVITSIDGYPNVGSSDANATIEWFRSVPSGNTTYDFYSFLNNRVLSLGSSGYSLTFSSLDPTEEDNVRCGRVVVSDGQYSETFYYIFQVTDIASTPIWRPVSGKLWDIDSAPTYIKSALGAGGSTPSAYEIKVDGNSVTNNSFSDVYNKGSHTIALYENGTVVTSQLLWVLDGTIVTAPAGTGSLTFSDVCSFAEVDVRGVDVSPISFAITPKSVSATAIKSFNKYFDGLDMVVIPADAFSYSGWLDNDANDITVYPSGTYARVGNRNTDTTNIAITFSFGLEGGNSSNYVIAPPEGVTGNIYAMLDASKPTKNGFALKVTKGRYGVAGSVDLTDSADLSNNSDDNPFEVSYDAAGYYITVIKDNVIVDDDDYYADWIVAITYPDDSSSVRIRPASTSVGFTDTGLCMGRVYVQGISNNASYTQGYAYVGEVWLRILPVINVSWIACSYEG